MNINIPLAVRSNSWLESWNEGNSTNRENLIKISILRKLLTNLHAEKGRLFATGQANEAEPIKTIESRVIKARDSDLTGISLEDLVDSTKDLKPIHGKADFPQKILEQFGREALKREDRTWERRLILEAVSANWGFAILRAAIPLQQAEDFHHQIESELWPNGVVLWVSQSETQDSSDWVGEWFCTLSSSAQPGAPISIDGKSKGSWSIIE